MNTSDRFWLTDDKEKARVRFLIEKWEDVYLSHIHEVKVENKDGVRSTKRIRCLGDNCIACKRGNRLINKIYIPLYNMDLQKVQFWERTPASQYLYFNTVFTRHDNPTSAIFEITRYGHKGDIHTKYEIVCVGDTDENLPSCEEIPNIVGNFFEIVDEYSLKQYLDKELEILRLEAEENEI